MYAILMVLVTFTIIYGNHLRALGRALAQIRKLTARGRCHCGRARIVQGFRARMNNFHSVLLEVLNTAQLFVENGWFMGVNPTILWGCILVG